MSDRSPITDALATLGMIHFKPENRDAIHLAVEPVEAAFDLMPGQRIYIEEGKAYSSLGGNSRYHGIVDPFLVRGPKKGERFWFIMAPRVVTSLRHVWEHPDFPKGA